MDYSFLLILAIGLGAMFLLSSRQRKAQRQQLSFRDNLQPGQEVMTGSGMYGTVVEVEDDVVTLESTPGNRSRWIKAAIARLVEPPVEEDEVEDEDDAEWRDEPGAVPPGLIDVPDDLSSLQPPRDDEGPDGRKKPQQ
ncbi:MULTISPECIES: preprotein translocase subunit YajC [unclassified Cellulomonas]|uniref:preprotein translocase subunit YajC n=1 Tax=unclassified Cellulomonas TaxID=2620175 RepID=UPI0019BB8B9E|nr:preprotein translocase subunit YajC [Cellulomonas sp. ES6]MBD3778532.1 preprotein translocase subunit YajC [Micrococcales bacterium]WHP17745.1 preprotein translocase subunit YajC [Cellulomonas sp. ES6]